MNTNCTCFNYNEDALIPCNLDRHSPLPGTIKLRKDHTLPRADLQFTLVNRNALT